MGRRAVTRTPLLFFAAAELGPQRVHALHGQSRVVSRGESRLMIRCISWMRARPRAALEYRGLLLQLVVVVETPESPDSTLERARACATWPLATLSCYVQE